MIAQTRVNLVVFAGAEGCDCHAVLFSSIYSGEGCCIIDAFPSIAVYICKYFDYCICECKPSESEIKSIKKYIKSKSSNYKNIKKTKKSKNNKSKKNKSKYSRY